MPLAIVSTFKRRDLVAVTARWRWEAFFAGSGRRFQDVLAGARGTAAVDAVMPRTLVLLAGVFWRRMRGAGAMRGG
jgi:hypothetical protein